MACWASEQCMGLEKVLGLMFFGSYLIWMGLFFSVVCTMLRKREIIFNENFSNKIFWNHMFVVVTLVAIAIFASTKLVNSCEMSAGNEAFLKCFKTRLSVNLLAPIPPWIVSCLLWRKMTAHKI